MIDVLLIVRRYGFVLVGLTLIAALLPPPFNQLVCMSTVVVVVGTLLSGMLGTARPQPTPSGEAEPSRMAEDPWAPTADESPPVPRARGVPDDVPRGIELLPAFRSSMYVDEDDPTVLRVEATDDVDE